jgi:LuxR family maltose regulon positive regulatory protein
MCTSILTRFCPALCAAVLEIDETVAQQHISHVARANLFLIELSSPAHWHRYHHQFQGMLLSRLHGRYDQPAIARLHRQAAGWLAAHDQVDEALRHLTAIPDFVAAAELIESQRVAALNEHRFQELERWLALLPAHLLNQRPALLVCLAWVQNHRLEYTQCLATIQRAAALLREQADTIPEVTQLLLQAALVALRTSVDDTLAEAEALALIYQTWMQIRPYLAYTHFAVVVWLADTCYRLGESEQALEILLTTFEQSTEWPPMARCRLLYSAGTLYWFSCNLAQAERAFQRALHLARQSSLHLAETLCHFGLAVIATLRNQHELAENYHLKVIREPYYQNGLRAVVCAYSLIGIYALRDQPEAGRSLVDELKTHAVTMGRPYFLNQVAALEAYVALRCGDLAAALRWALAESRGEMSSSTDRVPLIRAQVLMAEESPASLHEASQILQKLSRYHESRRSWVFWMDAIILLALTWAKLGQMASALAALGSAVQRGVPNGLVGPFIDQGQPLVRLLHELGRQPAYTHLVQLLLAAFPVDQAVPAAPAPVEKLPEPLTERELDVLKLLANRLSNKEIALQLIVSVHTVRNHTANIFGKLQVDNRVQAVKRARALGLIARSPVR